VVLHVIVGGLMVSNSDLFSTLPDQDNHHLEQQSGMMSNATITTKVDVYNDKIN